MVMKQINLILAAMLLLCLAPMPYGYFMLVRYVMMIDGAYDAVLQLEKHRSVNIALEQESNINDDINTNIKISTKKNEERLIAEVKANKELLEKLAKTQAELLQTAIEKWREEELAKINENPSAYIQTTNRS